MSGDKRGFTIVELLIVIIVIAILAAISVVAYKGIQSRAHDIAIKSDFRSILSKLQVYKIDNGAFPYDINGNSGGGCGTPASGVQSILKALDKKIFDA